MDWECGRFWNDDWIDCYCYGLSFFFHLQNVFDTSHEYMLYRSCSSIQRYKLNSNSLFSCNQSIKKKWNEIILTKLKNENCKKLSYLHCTYHFQCTIRNLKMKQNKVKLKYNISFFIAWCCCREFHIFVLMNFAYKVYANMILFNWNSIWKRSKIYRCALSMQSQILWNGILLKVGIPQITTKMSIFTLVRHIYVRNTHLFVKTTKSKEKPVPERMNANNRSPRINLTRVCVCRVIWFYNEHSI